MESKFLDMRPCIDDHVLHKHSKFDLFDTLSLKEWSEKHILSEKHFAYKS